MWMVTIKFERYQSVHHAFETSSCLLLAIKRNADLRHFHAGSANQTQYCVCQLSRTAHLKKLKIWVVAIAQKRSNTGPLQFSRDNTAVSQNTNQFMKIDIAFTRYGWCQLGQSRCQ